MVFIHQLRILLWKNFSLRKRQPLRNIIEIFWPLALFVILVLVRQRRQPENRPHSFYKPRALPSAGAIPFLQSFICDFANSNTSSPEDLPNFSNGSLYKLAEDLGPFINNETNVELLTRLFQNYNDLRMTLEGLNVLNISATFKPGSSLGTILNDPQVAKQFILDHTQLNKTYVDALFDSPINFDKAAEFYIPFIEDLQNPTQAIANIMNLPNKLKTVLCVKPGLKAIFDMPSTIYKDTVQNQLCQFSTVEWIQLVRDLQAGINVTSLLNVPKDLKNFQKLMDAYKALGEETARLNEDVRALESLGPALRDLAKLTQVAEGDSALDIRSVICGHKGKKKKRKIDASLYNKIREEKSKDTTVEGTECSDIKPQTRVDCGWPGISEGTCLNMGCCYDSSISSAKYCFCKPGQQRCCTVFNQFVRLIGGVTGQAGAGYADSGFVMFAALILRGKVFYTPDTAKTRVIIRKVNSFIANIDSLILSAGRLKKPLEAIMNYTDTMQGSNRLSNITVNRDTLNEIAKQLQRMSLTRYAELINRTEVLDFINNIDTWKNQTSILYNLLDLVGNVAQCFNTTNFFQAFPDEESLVKRAVDQTPGQPLFLSSIVFLNLDDGAKDFPKKVEYKLRLNPDFTPGTNKVKAKYWRPGPGPYGSSGFTTLSYLNFGFIFLQDLVERAFVEVLTNKSLKEPGVYVQQFPYPCYIKDRFTFYISRALPLFMTLAWVYTVAMIVKSIVYEKELRLKEVMKIMGLSNSVHWAAWFITSLVTMLITIIFQCILWKFGGILQYSDPTLVFFMLFVFAIASINLCFLISIFFSKANIAAACGGIIYFFTYLPYPITIWFEEQMSAAHKSLAGLLSTTAFGMGCQYLSRYEEQGIGAQWSNYYKSPLPDDNYSLGMTINMMMLDAVIYFVLVWYFEKVMPGKYGIPKPFYFPFTKAYWLGKDEIDKDYFTVDSNYSGNNEPVIEMPERLNGCVASSDSTLFTKGSGNFEEDPALPVGVHIQNLVKVYRQGGKRAVDGLTLKLFEGQVTSLLGHNGAGKSTTMSVLTGLFPPTAGTAVIYGEDIRTNMDTIRKGLGVCPQHSVLFDDLTVEEHMWFYAKLKGMKNEHIPAEIVKFLHDVGLPEKRREVAKNLSGGMKRKLSVALAFIANSRTVILDEPTAGIDPYSRRGIWDLILKYKHGKTILLSTHYMDEADLLGDRISIIDNGKLKCCGSSLFLKRKFGKGYFLTLVKNTKPKSLFHEETLTRFVASYVSGSFLKEHAASEISYVLPSVARESGCFGRLFRNLEASLSDLGITDYGISDTTLEEVFLEACNEKGRIMDDDDNISLTGPLQRRRRSIISSDPISVQLQSEDTGMLIPSEGEEDGLISPPPSKNKASRWIRQFLAFLVRRFHHARRSRKGFFSQIVLPAIFVAAAMIVSLLRPPRHALPSLKLSPAQYGSGQYMFVRNNNQSLSSQSFKLTKTLVEDPGPGPDCTRPSKCTKGPKYPFFDYDKLWVKKTKEYPPCSCTSGKMVCSKSSYGPDPPQAKIATEQTVIDLSTRNVADYIIKTTPDMVKLRYGGITFGEISKYYPNVATSRFSTRNLINASGTYRNAKVWFNNKGFHSMPTYLNVLNNALLRSNLNPNEDPRDYGIVAYNHPMNYNKEQLSDETLMQGFTDLFVAIFVIVALSFVPASFIVYLVSDRVSNSKHLQFVCGLNPTIYWLGNYVWDLVNYLLPAFCCILIFLAFNQKAYVSEQNFPVTLSLLLFYGWSMTPLMYPSSFVFKVPSTAYIVLICGNLFVGIVGTISTFILELFQDDQELLGINNQLKKIFLIFPNYCLGRGLMDMARNQFESEIYARFGEARFKDPFSWELAGRNLFAMFVGGVVFLTINLLIEYNFFFRPSVKPVKTTHAGIDMSEDSDVREEKERVMSYDSQENDAIRVVDLVKIYKKRFPKGSTLAVDRLNFGVQKGECFGLLGVNGAGKTTTFKMLTGDGHISGGNAFIHKHSVLTNLNDAHQLMGYCPQFDALDELLTARETLRYFARIKGFKGDQVQEIVDWGINELGLVQHADTPSGELSGGNRRKLSTALALLGYPPIIFLDEPTTGMDPGARRFLWNIITDVVKLGKSVVLTSHSMEECETLCTRLAIMVNGRFMCFGSPQHLRSKYGDGYTLIIRAKYSEVDLCKDFVTANFPFVKLKDEHYNMLEFSLPASNLKLSQVFDILENLRETVTIYDYSVSQTTLDQIFVNFARRQTEGIEVPTEEQKYSVEA